MENQFSIKDIIGSIEDELKKGNTNPGTLNELLRRKLSMENLNTIKSKVENLLEKLPETRNSDKLLQHYYWTTYDNVTDLNNWLSRATDPESIRRCRQKIQEERPDLKANLEVQEARYQKQESFLNFVQ